MLFGCHKTLPKLVESKLLRIELNNRELPFLRLLTPARLVTITVIEHCPIFENYDARCIDLDL